MPKKINEVNCAFCSKTYCNPQIYYKHANRDHNQDVLDSWYPCELCQIYLPTEEVLKKHKSCVHSVKEAPARIQCTFCEKTHCNTHEFYKHANRLHSDEVLATWFPCVECSIYFPDEDVLKNHSFQAHSNSSSEITERVTCPHCPKHFSRTVEFYKHINNAHLQHIIMDWLQCDMCEMFFPRPDVLERHRSRVHSIRKISQRAVHCIYCMQAFIRLEEYYHHANNEHQAMVSESWVKCGLCEMYLPDNHEIDRHVNEDHQVSEDQDPEQVILPQEIDVDSNDQGVKCLNCSKRFPNNQMLSAHIKTVHRTIQTSPLAKKRTYQETRPSSAYDPVVVTPPKIFQMRNANGAFKCNECNIEFPSLPMLQLHNAFLHSQSSPLHPIVNPSTSTILQANPVKSEPVDPEWLTCPHCSRLFRSQLILNAHVSFVHPHAPTQSHLQSIPQRNSDQVDFRVGTGSVSVKVICRFCGDASFADSEAYFLHANYAHAHLVDVSGWIRCQACQLRLPSDSHLERHRAKAHSRQEICDPLTEKNDDCDSNRSIVGTSYPSQEGGTSASSHPAMLGQHHPQPEVEIKSEVFVDGEPFQFF